MLKSSAAVALATLISRILGLVRESVYARFMGNGWVASAFLFAYQIPNLFRRLLGEGALTTAFIPEFKAKERTEGEAAMWHAANAVVSGLFVVASAVTGIAMLALSGVLALGEFGERTRLMLGLLRLMFPYMLLVCLAAVFMGMLNARGRFFIPALGAALLNVIMIASVVLVAPRFGTELPEQIHALAFGVLAAGLAQACFQIPSLRRQGWRYRWVNPWRNPTVHQVARRMIPATLGVATYQLNVLITQGFAFFLGETVVASFQYAVRLMELPQGLFGGSLATYLLPALSGLAAEKRYDDYRKTLLQGLSYLTVVNVLAAILLITLAHPIVRLLFEGGRFSPSATLRVAAALRYLGPGLIAFSMTNILARAFYAVGDTKVPMQISVFCLAANAVLSVIFVLPMEASGLALANTLTAVMNTSLLAYALRRKFPKLEYAPLVQEALRTLAAGAAAAAAALFATGFWETALGAGSLALKTGAVFGPAIFAALVYGATAWAFGVPTCRQWASQGFNRLFKR